MKKLFVLVITLCFAYKGLTQCPGTLGNPIVSIDFGQTTNSNTPYGPALSSVVTSYNYRADNNIGDGDYTITNNSKNGRPEWHNAPDHTSKNGTGYMLLVNAAYTKGQFYKTRVSGLCTNTQFEFSAWVLNALPQGICNPNPVLPDVRFEIRTPSNVLLASVDSGKLPNTSSPQWKRFALSFNSGIYSEFDVILINNSDGGCGNDLAIDDIQFRACGDMANITSSIDYKAICPNNVPSELTLNADIQGNIYNSPVLQWQRLDNNKWTDIIGEYSTSLTISPIIPNISYRYKLANSASNLLNDKCYVISEVATIQFTPVLQLKINGPNELCDNETDRLTINASHTLLSSIWTLPNGQKISSSSIDINGQSQNGNYQLDVIDNYGCSYSTNHNVTIKQSIKTKKDITACVDDIIIIGDGESYRVSKTESIMRTIARKINNCDSIITYNINALPRYNESKDSIVCRGDAIIDPNGQSRILNTNQSFTYNLKTKAGCDSIIQKNFIVPQPVDFEQKACQNDEVVLPDGQQIVANNSFKQRFILDSKAHSCDSIINYSLFVNPTQNTETDYFTCPNVPFKLPNGTYVDKEGQYTEKYTNQYGCDSIITYNVQYQIESCDFDLLCQIRFPTIISPNNDGINDHFKPLINTLCTVENYELTVFNRWGNILFNTSDLSEAWLPQLKNYEKIALWTLSYDVSNQDNEAKHITDSGVVHIIY